MSNTTTCPGPECTRIAGPITGLCEAHADQRRAGKPLQPIRVYGKTLEQRFWAKVDKSGKCWQWTAFINEWGYGQFGSDPGESNLAHRWLWEATNGPVPDGLVLDHMCHNRACVRLDHLRLATHKGNSEHRRGPNRNNKGSGVRNVYSKDGGWSVKIRHYGRLFSFGTYSTIAEAEAVAIRERKRLFPTSDVPLPT